MKYQLPNNLGVVRCIRCCGEDLTFSSNRYNPNYDYVCTKCYTINEFHIRLKEFKEDTCIKVTKHICPHCQNSIRIIEQ